MVYHVCIFYLHNILSKYSLYFNVVFLTYFNLVIGANNLLRQYILLKYSFYLFIILLKYSCSKGNLNTMICSLSPFLSYFLLYNLRVHFYKMLKISNSIVSSTRRELGATISIGARSSFFDAQQRFFTILEIFLIIHI